MLRAYEGQLVGPVPMFPQEIEQGIDRYLAAMPTDSFAVEGVSRKRRD